MSRTFHPKVDVAGDVFEGLFDKEKRTISKASLEKFFETSQGESPPPTLTKDEYDVTEAFNEFILVGENFATAGGEDVHLPFPHSPFHSPHHHS